LAVVLLRGRRPNIATGVGVKPVIISVEVTLDYGELDGPLKRVHAEGFWDFWDVGRECEWGGMETKCAFLVTCIAGVLDNLLMRQAFAAWERGEEFWDRLERRRSLNCRAG
jgi:hypothetical protein